MIGLIFLGSDVLNMKPRDEYLHLSKDKLIRGQELKDYFNLGVCVGIQPISWYWNIGKLVALLACTLGDFINKAYPEVHFKGITTTSLWGKSVQYDRVYKLLGYTKGFGTEHVSDIEYKEMVKWLDDNGIKRPPWRTSIKMMTINQYLYYHGSDKTASVKHGHIRGIYYHDAIPSDKRQDVINDWFNRWGLPRYNRLKDMAPPYINGKEGGKLATSKMEVVK